MRDKLHSAFPQCVTNNCIEVAAHEKFHICDTDNGKCCIFIETDEIDYPYFTVNNPIKKEVAFLAIDNCIYFAEDGKKCDFAIFSDDTFCFIELKRALGSHNGRSARRRDAAEQLKITISKFKSKVDFTGVKLEACLCVGYNSPHPRARASSQSMAKYFIDNFNTELFEGNCIDF